MSTSNWRSCEEFDLKISKFCSFAWRNIAFAAGCLLVTPLYGADAPSPKFKIQVGQAGGDIEDFSCQPIGGKTNRYGTKTITTTQTDLWGCKTADACERNEWSLTYQRVGQKKAIAGRCTTPVSDKIAGDGVFSARIYLHDDILNSSGVYTIAILPEPFKQKEELDLVVVNLKDDKVYFGTPSRATSLPLAGIIEKWITVSMKKKGTTCHLTITSDQGEIIDLGVIYCNINDKANKIVLNARAGHSDKKEPGMFTVSSVKWLREK